LGRLCTGLQKLRAFSRPRPKPLVWSPVISKPTALPPWSLARRWISSNAVASRASYSPTYSRQSLRPAMASRHAGNDRGPGIAVAPDCDETKEHERQAAAARLKAASANEARPLPALGAGRALVLAGRGPSRWGFPGGRVYFRGKGQALLCRCPCRGAARFKPGVHRQSCALAAIMRAHEAWPHALARCPARECWTQANALIGASTHQGLLLKNSMQRIGLSTLSSCMLMRPGGQRLFPAAGEPRRDGPSGLLRQRPSSRKCRQWLPS